MGNAPGTRTSFASWLADGFDSHILHYHYSIGSMLFGSTMRGRWDATESVKLCFRVDEFDSHTRNAAMQDNMDFSWHTKGFFEFILL